MQQDYLCRFILTKFEDERSLVPIKFQSGTNLDFTKILLHLRKFYVP